MFQIKFCMKLIIYSCWIDTYYLSAETYRNYEMPFDGGEGGAKHNFYRVSKEFCRVDKMMRVALRFQF